MSRPPTSDPHGAPVTGAPSPGSTGASGDSGSTALADLHRAVSEGRIAESLPRLAALQEHPHGLGPADRAILLATLVECRLARGELSDALELAGDLANHLDDEGLAGAVAHFAKGELAAAMGDAESALGHYEVAGERSADASPALLPWRASAALALVRTGRRREAASLAHEYLAHARGSGSDVALAHALRTLATADPAGDAIAHLRAARAALRDTVAERLAAQIDTDLAGLMILVPGAGTPEQARELLRSAETYAGRQGLWPLQGRVRRVLERLGESPVRVPSEALAALTAAERRVAVLAADGLTNRQVAAELGVTVKAVEWHLSHVYRKLEIASRTHLVTQLGAAAG